jgi:hypothetical protein
VGRSVGDEMSNYMLVSLVITLHYITCYGGYVRVWLRACGYAAARDAELTPTDRRWAWG